MYHQSPLNASSKPKNLIFKQSTQSIQRITKKHDTTLLNHEQNHHDCHHGHCNHSHFHAENHKLKAIIGLAWGFGQFLLPLSMPFLSISNAIVTLYLGLSVYKSAWQALNERQIVMTTLYAISTLSILCVSIFSYFIPWLPMMSEAAPLILGFWHLGEFIENQLVSKINQKLNVTDCLLPKATIKGTPNKSINIKKINPNDILIINNGEVIPVDGILNTPSTISTTRIDGSPFPKTLEVGALLKSGMSVVGDTSFIEMQATHNYDESYLSKVAKNIKKAHLEKAPIELLANKILSFFIPGLISIAITSSIVIACYFGPVAAIQCVISVLVSACPCALSLITPMAVKIGMQKASEKGIHFKNGKDLQAASQINDVVFDLNGTLTEGKFEIMDLNITDETLLPLVAALESHSKHPVAKVIQDYIENQRPVEHQSIHITQIDKTHHAGIKAVINGDTLMIGNSDFLKYHNIPIQTDKENFSQFIVKNGMVVGTILLHDALRQDAIATVQKLQQMGKTVHICTGTDKKYVERYAEILKIMPEHIFTNADDKKTKESYIRQLQANHRKVAMVGDAFNDAGAVAYADIGIAVKSVIGDKITEEQASITVPKGMLFSIVSALDVAEKTSSNIFQNLMISLSYNSVITIIASGAFLAIGISINPIVGVALMILESVIIFSNLLRFKNQDTVSLVKEKSLFSSNHFFDADGPKICIEPSRKLTT